MTRRSPAPSTLATSLLGLAAFCYSVCGSVIQTARAADAPIVVRNGKQIAAATIPCRRIALGEPEDYKPSVVQLPSGELLLVVFSGERVGGGKIREITRLYRSKDQGLSWSGPELQPRLLGREPYLSITRNGAIKGHPVDLFQPFTEVAIAEVTLPGNLPLTQTDHARLCGIDVSEKMDIVKNHEHGVALLEPLRQES